MIARYINPALHHLIAPDTPLDDLGICPVDRWGIACILEETHSLPETPQSVIDGWVTVGDVLGMVPCAS